MLAGKNAQVGDQMCHLIGTGFKLRIGDLLAAFAHLKCNFFRINAQWTDRNQHQAPIEKTPI